jgi:hypothetical protein
MNKEQIILDVYREHCLEQSKYLRHGGTIQEFINKCKTDTEFSEKWGLKIEERELSLEERYQIAIPIWKEKYGPLANMMVPTNVDNTPYKIPTKLITVTYNNETIESYENNS